MTSPQQLASVIASVRPALNNTETTEDERAQFAYDLLREVYDHVKFDVHRPLEDSDERVRIGEIVNVALPPRQQ
ncbi:MAG: hypothetical protein ACTH8F_08415 [Microbacterium sp.]|uniref:hypothetical protein n=1 Tax=Microbacterium sp. TaxID=51671 RepID=UPI003F9B084B